MDSRQDLMSELIPDQKKEHQEQSTDYITNNNNIIPKMEIDSTSDCSLSNCDIETETLKEIKSELSDTDSALSSINTIHSKSSAMSPSQSVYIGELVWGSFRQTSWFPCLVYPSSDPSNNSIGTSKILVKYFNYNGLNAFLPPKNVFEFDGIEEFWHEITKIRGIKRSRITSFNKSCRRAMEQAKLFKSFPICDRAPLLDFITELEKLSISLEELEVHIDETVVEAGYRENLKIFFRTMKNYDENVEVIEKTAIKKEIIKKEIDENLKTESHPNRRLSTRVTCRKRKFDEIQESTPEPTLISVESTSPSLKKPKLEKKAETLEERFLSDIKDIHYAFKNYSKSKACSQCLEKGEQQTFRCCGKHCANWFHETCFSKVEYRKEQFRHKTGDSDDIIETESLKAFYTCESCNNDERNCFVCQETVAVTDSIFSCTNSECKLDYHQKCLSKWPKNRNTCPQHYCHTCHSKNINKNGSLAKCMKCVASYHADIGCIPAGTEILTRTQVICPRHKSTKERNKKPLNIDWCSICTKGGELICCEGCPNAFHKDCLGDKYHENDEVFMCDECQDGRLPLYSTIVWARLGNYRWWPGFVMLPWTVPIQVMKRQEFQREFCIRFFGSNDFCFSTCERVLPYDLQSEDVYTFAKSGNKRLDSLYQLALFEANQMTKILNAENENTSDMKPKFYSKVTQNRPVPPVKLRSCLVEKCECSPIDTAACGRDSNCINMHLNFECDKSCPAGIKCQNQKLRNRENVDVKIVKTKNRGFGAVCVNDIQPDTFIIEYVGELIDNAELNRRMDRKIKKKEREFYFLTVESDLFVDAEFYANKSRFLNHSCDPNCETRKVTVDGNTRIGIFSKKLIPAGSELTFDYKMQFVSNLKTNCYCGSINCTGLIGDAKKIEEEKIKKVRKLKRKNEPKPIVQKRIERKSMSLLIENTIDPFDLMMQAIYLSEL